MSNSGKVWDIREAYKQQRNNAWSRGDIGVSSDSSSATVNKIQISTTGNASAFGDITVAGNSNGGAMGGSPTRLLFGGGNQPDTSNIICYKEFSADSNFADFGDLSVDRQMLTGASDGLRTVFAGGRQADGGPFTTSNRMDVSTFASLGNAVDFGDIGTSTTYTYFGGSSSETRGVFGGGGNPSNASIINFITMASTGNSQDFGDLTVDRITMSAAGNSNRVCFFSGQQNVPGGPGTNVIDFVTIATTGNASDFGDATGNLGFKTGGHSNGHGGIVLGELQRPSVTYMPGSGRGLFAGSHDPSASAVIDMISIPTLGNASDFGNLSVARGRAGAGSSLTRLVVGGGEEPSASNVIDSTEMQSQGNSADFGNLSVTRNQVGGLSNQTRAVFAGGFVSPTFYDTMDYITIATVGDATDFGNLSAAKGSIGTTSSSTRGLMGGGRSPSQTNVIEYITIGSTGDVTDFGDLTQVMSTNAGASSSTRGLFAGGLNPGDSAGINVTSYVTIASTGNATDFGDLTVARYIVGGGASNNIRAVFAGGKAPGTTNTIDYFTIATIGNAADFGDLNANDAGIAEGQCSDSHGGLQA